MKQLLEFFRNFRKRSFFLLITVLFLVNLISCRQTVVKEPVKIVFLHHSTGQNIWNGNQNTFCSRAASRISYRLSLMFYKNPKLPALFKKYNNRNHTDYFIKEMEFPKESPYGWNNDPYDYFNIWVNNAGEDYFKDEPTLEILSKEYQVIIFKHCFPVCNIQPEKDSADINSEYKSIANYKLQYFALKEKLLDFPETKFILFTGAAQVKSQITEDEAKRAKEFFEWVKGDWDIQGDNIHIWDLYSLETKGDIYLQDIYAKSFTDSHPNGLFSDYASGLLFNRIIDVITTNGLKTDLTGEKIL
jgi:hypothetical protein